MEQEFSKRKKYVANAKLEAFRLYDRASLELPLAIDIYKDNAVVHVFGYVAGTVLREVEKSIERLLPVKNFFYKNRTKSDLHLPQSDHKDLVIEEYGHKFSCNLSDYLDTGLFLDHRETRKWIAEESKGKTVLNTFAYTGSFSVYAVLSGR